MRKRNLLFVNNLVRGPDKLDASVVAHQYSFSLATQK